MARPRSFRLPEDLLARLDEEAAGSATSVSALVAALLDEGLKTRRFPGIVYRDGPTGRRAGLVGGPDVWEVVRAVRLASGKDEQRLRRVAEISGLPIGQVRLAVDFYSDFPDEVDARIAIDQRVAAHLQDTLARREQLMS